MNPKDIEAAAERLAELRCRGGTLSALPAHCRLVSLADSYAIRRCALQQQVPYATTIAGASAVVLAISDPGRDEINRLQDLHQEVAA